LSVLFYDEEEAIEYLQGLGYRVQKVSFPEVSSITSVKKLTEFFYYKRQQYNADRKYPYSIDYSEDAKNVSSFVKSREKLGLGHKQATQEAAQIIDGLFKYEERLNLSSPILSTKILAQRPIIDWVLSLMNDAAVDLNDAEDNAYADALMDEYVKKYKEDDEKRISEKRRQILEKLNV